MIKLNPSTLCALFAVWFPVLPALAKGGSSSDADLAVAAMKCSHIASGRVQEERLLELGIDSAKRYLDFVRGGGQSDFTTDGPGLLTNTVYHSFPNDDFALGALYNGLAVSLDDYLDWAKVHSVAHANDARAAEFKISNCAALR